MINVHGFVGPWVPHPSTNPLKFAGVGGSGCCLNPRVKPEPATFHEWVWFWFFPNPHEPSPLPFLVLANTVFIILGN